MHLNEMKLGKSLEIYVERDGYRYRVVSKIEDVSNDCVCITLIAARSRIFHFYDSDIIDFIYKDGNYMWKWCGVKGGVTMLDGDQVHCLSTHKKGEVYNRRDAFRVFMGEETRITYYSPETDNEGNTTEPEEELLQEKVCNGFIKDISENGLGIFTNQDFAMEDLIEIGILTDFGKIQCKGKVVRQLFEKHGVYKNFYGVNFTQTSKNLSKFIFAQQRIQLQGQRNPKN